MNKCLSVKELREFDRWAIHKLGIPENVLIENASRGACDVVEAIGLLDSCMVFAGCGNNGADGLALARHLFNRGVDVWVCIVGTKQKHNQELNFQLGILNKLIPDRIRYVENIADIPGFDYEMIAIDAVFGIGFHGQLGDLHQKIFHCINKFKHVVSLDIPSGIEADAVNYNDNAVKANVTVTFIALKKAFQKEPFKSNCGKIYVKDIGVIYEK